jgi:hypothetical protein
MVRVHLHNTIYCRRHDNKLWDIYYACAYACTYVCMNIFVRSRRVLSTDMQIDMRVSMNMYVIFMHMHKNVLTHDIYTYIPHIYAEKRKLAWLQLLAPYMHIYNTHTHTLQKGNKLT